MRWSSRSSNVNLENFLWGFLKEPVYREVINTRAQLQRRILEAASEIRENFNNYSANVCSVNMAVSCTKILRHSVCF